MPDMPAPMMTIFGLLRECCWLFIQSARGFGGMLHRGRDIVVDFCMQKACGFFIPDKKLQQLALMYEIKLNGLEGMLKKI